MIGRIRAFFQGEMTPPPPGEGSDGPSAEDLRVAACALFLEVAYADDFFSADERKHLRNLVRRHFRLKPEAVEELIVLADDERRRRVDMWGFANLIREHYSIGQKMVLAEAMWGLVLADGTLAGREDYIMRKISALLGLKPGYLSEAKRRHEQAEQAERAGGAGGGATPDADGEAGGRAPEACDGGAGDTGSPTSQTRVGGPSDAEGATP